MTKLTRESILKQLKYSQHRVVSEVEDETLWSVQISDDALKVLIQLLEEGYVKGKTA